MPEKREASFTRVSFRLMYFAGNAGRECLVAVVRDSGDEPEKIPKVENSQRVAPAVTKNSTYGIPSLIVSCPRIEYI